MLEATGMHMSDTHQDAFMVAAGIAITDIEDIDFCLHTGDFVGKRHGGVGGEHETLEEVLAKNIQEVSQNSPHARHMQQILQKYEGSNIQSIEDITDESDREQYAQSYQMHMQELQKAVLGAAVEAYQGIKEGLAKLAQKTKIVGVMGNHDLTIGYQVLSDVIDFAELKDEIRVKGKSGKDFVIKGTINSWEMPKSYSHPIVQQVLGEYFINYLEGHGEDEEGIRDNPQMVEAVKKTHEKERQRLNATGDADIFLTHKAPAGFQGGFGEHVNEYSAKAKSTYGGHGHGGQIRIINGKPIFQPGTNHIFVYDYDDNHNVEAVRIYRVRDVN